MGPLGPLGLPRLGEDDLGVGREEQGRNPGRLPGFGRQQEQYHPGPPRPRPRPGTTSSHSTVERCRVRRRRRSGRRHHATAHGQVRQARSRLRVSRQGQWPLAGRSGAVGFCAAAALRTHQHAQADLQCRRAGLVPGPRSIAGCIQGVDLRQAVANGGGHVRRPAIRLALAAIPAAPTPTRHGARPSALSGPTW